MNQPVNLFSEKALRRYRFLTHIIDSVDQAVNNDLPDHALYEFIRLDMNRALNSARAFQGIERQEPNIAEVIPFQNYRQGGSQ